MLLRNVTLELSGKAFRDDREETMRQVGEKLFLQWKNLTDTAEEITLMLWIADGSEILTYTGDLNDTFEWAYWQGCAEALKGAPEDCPRIKRHTHFFPKKYRHDAAPRSYGWLKKMIAVLRECCQKINHKPLRVEAIFDNGPEFNLSDFKYRLHPEICGGTTVGSSRSVTCNSTLHGDHRKYAAFPEGIPEGITLGKFLGKQFRAFAGDLGYDAIWLSNGMGFGRDTWGITGFLFDKKAFHPEMAKEAREAMLAFWKDFTEFCPGSCIDTRGSNYSAGVELASDAAPLRELYTQFRIAPPVNSPWAALNFNTGLEIAAWMSHIAELPDHRFPYRFYPHDPWFLNSPWLDRYAREPWDIYLPLSVSRIGADGKVHTPDSVNFLSVDDSWGQMPDQVPQEVIPHILEAFRTAPDSTAPFVWVYPFFRYCDMVHGPDPHPETVLNEDLFLGETIQSGFPLNTVVSLDHFDKVSTNSIVILPVSGWCPEAEKFLDAGGRIVFYGSLNLAPEALWKRLGLRKESGKEGERTVTVHYSPDTFRHGNYASRIFCHPVFDGGPLTEAAAEAEVLAEAEGRVLASVCGNAAFLRSVLPQGKEIYPEDRDIDRADPSQAFPVEILLREIVSRFGWIFHYDGWKETSMLPRMNLSRHQNAFYYAVFARDTTAGMQIRTPLGAPILDETETELRDGMALWHPAKCSRHRCRVLLDQKNDGVISCKIRTSEEPGMLERFELSGMEQADLRFFLPEDLLSRMEAVNCEEPWQFLRKDPLPYEIEETELGKCAVLRNVTGKLIVGVGKQV